MVRTNLRGRDLGVAGVTRRRRAAARLRLGRSSPSNGLQLLTSFSRRASGTPDRASLCEEAGCLASAGPGLGVDARSRVGSSTSKSRASGFNARVTPVEPCGSQRRLPIGFCRGTRGLSEEFGEGGRDGFPESRSRRIVRSATIGFRIPTREAQHFSPVARTLSSSNPATRVGMGTSTSGARQPRKRNRRGEKAPGHYGISQRTSAFGAACLDRADRVGDP